MATAVVLLAAAGSFTIVLSQTGGDDKLTAQEIALASQNTYAALSSYSDTGTAVAEGGGPGTKTTFSIRLQRPNLYRVDAALTGGYYDARGAAWSDRTGNYFAFGAASQFADIKPTKMHSMQMALLAAGSAWPSWAIPATFFNFNSGDQLKTVASPRASVRREHDQEIGDASCFLISYTLGSATLPQNKGVSGR